MTNGPIFFLGGYILAFVGSLVIAVLLVGHSRGGARIVGLIGALVIMAGALVPILAEVSGNSLLVFSPDAAVESYHQEEASDVLLAALPGTLIGLGLIGIAVAVIRPGPGVGDKRQPRSDP